MPRFTFRAVERAPNGILGPTLHEQVIETPDAGAAIAAARGIDLDMAALGANAVYLSDVQGRVLWSLHASHSVVDGEQQSAWTP